MNWNCTVLRDWGTMYLEVDEKAPLSPLNWHHPATSKWPLSCKTHTRSTAKVCLLKQNCSKKTWLWSKCKSKSNRDCCLMDWWSCVCQPLITWIALKDQSNSKQCRQCSKKCAPNRSASDTNLMLSFWVLLERNGCVSTKGITIEHVHSKSINGRSEPDRLPMAP